MLKHYLKIAIRNLLKYRSQSFISIFGLAIGFTCFALGTLWIHYEMTYDSFHKDADRIYLVRQKSLISNGGLTDTPKPLAASLKQKWAASQIPQPVHVIMSKASASHITG